MTSSTTQQDPATSIRRTVGIAAIAGIWTVMVWGNRIGLLTGAERADATSWLRIGGSLAFAVTLLLAAMVMYRSGRRIRWYLPLAWFFLGFQLLVWLPSLARVLPGTESVAFKLVHAVLATVSLTIAAVALWDARR